MPTREERLGWQPPCCALPLISRMHPTPHTATATSSTTHIQHSTHVRRPAAAWCSRPAMKLQKPGRCPHSAARCSAASRCGNNRPRISHDQIFFLALELALTTKRHLARAERSPVDAKTNGPDERALREPRPRCAGPSRSLGGRQYCAHKARQRRLSGRRRTTSACRLLANHDPGKGPLRAQAQRVDRALSVS